MHNEDSDGCIKEFACLFVQILRGVVLMGVFVGGYHAMSWLMRLFGVLR